MSRLRWFLLVAVVVPGAAPLRAQLIQPNVIVSVRDQKLMLLDTGGNTAVYPVSTSKFGLGDSWGSMATPLGTLQVAQKIGDHAPTGAVFHNRRFTGEILQPNTPGRDPIITRIIWLRGLEAENAVYQAAARGGDHDTAGADDGRSALARRAGPALRSDRTRRGSRRSRRRNTCSV